MKPTFSDEDEELIESDLSNFSMDSSACSGLSLESFCISPIMEIACTFLGRFSFLSSALKFQ